MKYALYILLLTLFSCKTKPYPESSHLSRKTRIEEITFLNTSAQIRISGTLTYPHSHGNFPALVLIPGSGHTNRDGSDNDFHRPLYELADYFTKRGFAVLRCDKRGVGKSEGKLDFNTTLEDLATDIKSSLEYLKSRQMIDTSRIGLIGHSKGGLVAEKVAAEMPGISYIIVLGSPGIIQSQIVNDQIAAFSKFTGIPDTTVNKFQIITSTTTDILISEANPGKKLERIRKMYKNLILTISDQELVSLKQIGYVLTRNDSLYAEMVFSPFWFEFYTVDPGSIIKNVKCPVLSVIGDKDLQVPAEKNQLAIKNALERGGNKDYTLKTPEGMNHLFQPTTTGSPEEYYNTEESMSKPVLDTINNWILKHLKE